MKSFINRLFSYILISIIRFYRLVISPHTARSCRHFPSCSEYTIEAIKIHGVFHGTFLAVKRISSCHPKGTFGYDPVPEKIIKN